MRFLILAAALAAPSSASSAPAAPAPAVAPPAAFPGPVARPSTENCRRPDVIPADTPSAPEAERLGELPPGDLFLSVYREVEGCMRPVIVRYGGRRGAEAVPAPAAPPRARVWR